MFTRTLSTIFTFLGRQSPGNIPVPLVSATAYLRACFTVGTCIIDLFASNLYKKASGVIEKYKHPTFKCSTDTDSIH